MHRSRILTAFIATIAATGIVLVPGNPASAATKTVYAALGDSYSSGVGAGSYISSSGSCKRSSSAYPAVWAASHPTASYVSVACSTATAKTVTSSQLGALSTKTTLVSLTVGGNDAGFLNIMTKCILLGTAACVKAVDESERFIASAGLRSQLDPVYSSIRSRAPNARVVVLGYPIFYRLGTFRAGLSETSRAKINEGINMLNDVTRILATRHGFTFADVRPAFIGHQLGDSDVWLHDLNIADMSLSYHPTAWGQSRGYARVFASVTG